MRVEPGWTILIPFLTRDSIRSYSTQTLRSGENKAEMIDQPVFANGHQDLSIFTKSKLYSCDWSRVGNGPSKIRVGTLWCRLVVLFLLSGLALHDEDMVRAVIAGEINTGGTELHVDDGIRAWGERGKILKGIRRQEFNISRSEPHSDQVPERIEGNTLRPKSDSERRAEDN